MFGESRTGASLVAAFRVDCRNIKHAAKRKTHFDRMGTLNKGQQDIMCYRTAQNQHRNFNVAFGTQTNGNEEPGF